jgi:secondary thiamine-phosphate synthase enzyme
LPSSKLSAVHTARIETIASAVLSVQTSGEGFFEITDDVARFLEQVQAGDGAVLVYLKHTSASLVIQENADPDVQTDLVTALERLAPADAGWVHSVEGPDDMPAHIKSMLNGVSLQVPVAGGELALGTWQGIYVAEHRAHAHRREVALQFLGSREPGRPIERG